MYILLLSIGQGDEMPFSHSDHVPVWCGRTLFGAGSHPVLQWRTRIYKRTVCEVFVLRILSLAPALYMYFHQLSTNFYPLRKILNNIFVNLNTQRWLKYNSYSIYSIIMMR